MLNSTFEVLKPLCAAQSIGVGNLAITALIQYLIGSYCGIANYNWPPDYGPIFLATRASVYDYIIVGGGTAGSVLAGRLSEIKSNRILLIEAGDDPPVESEIPAIGTLLEGSTYDWNYVTRTNNKSCLSFPGGACPWPRGKMLGGCSSINGMIFVRGNRRDFDHWAELGNPTWDWDSVLPYFKKTEDYRPPNPYKIHGEGGPMVVDRFNDFPQIKEKIYKAAVEAGYERVDEFRDGHNLGFGELDSLIIDSRRNTPAKAFLTTVKPNLDIIKNAIVTKINFDENKRARSVNFEYTDKRKVTHSLVAEARKEIIVSAGTVESPKLLMLSGIGPRKHLESLNIPVLSDLSVGKNLHDHPILPIYFSYKGPKENPLNDMYNYLAHGTGRLASIHMIDLAAFLDVNNKTGVYPDLQVHHLWYGHGAFPLVPATNPAAMLLLNKIYLTSGILGSYLVVVNPDSRGYIKLCSTDYRRQPIIQPNYLGDYRDVQIYIDGIRRLRELQKTPTFLRENIKFVRINLPECSQYPYDSDRYWECYIRHSSYLIFHPVGTVKMGPDSDPDAVVDYRLRVRGVKGLRVIDASIMPKIVSANPMAATIMIAEKGADFVKEDN